MGFLERRTDQNRPGVDGPPGPGRAPEDRYGTKPGPRTTESNEPLYEPAAARRSNPDPVGLPSAPPAPPPADVSPSVEFPPSGEFQPSAGFPPVATFPPAAAPVEPPAPGPAGRSDLTLLLGRTVLEARVQQICREYGLLPRSGSVGSGLSRAYLARDAGVELAADAHGMITTVFLHFHGDDGFTSYAGEIPGGAGSVPRRSHLWAMLGHPGEQGDPYHDRFLGDYGPWDRWLLPGLALHAQYAVDGESLERVTLTLPDRLPRAA